MKVWQPGLDYVGISTPFYCHDGHGHFVFHKRSQSCRDEQGHWDTGSGKLEFGFSVKDNVLKEVKEEYGCAGIIQEQLPAHSVLRQLNGKPTHWLLVPFFILVDRKSVVNNEPAKIDDIGWFQLTKLPKPTHTGFLYTFAHYRQFFEKYMQLK